MIGRKLVLNDVVYQVIGKTQNHWQARAVADQSEVDIEFQLLADAMSNRSAWWLGRGEEEE